MNFTKEHIPFSHTHQFSKLFIDYVNRDHNLADLYSSYFDKQGMENYLATTDFSYVNREVVSIEIQRQNHSFPLSASSQKNIQSLQNTNTYTVTTGHQLCLFTGPLYFIYKIITVINYCEFLNKTFPDKHFVPVYWLASEDHDFEEISNANVFSKEIVWQTKQSGKVGKFSTEGITNVVEVLQQILGESEQSIKITEFLKNCYSKPTLTEATRMMVNGLFGKYGLVIVDGDTPILKQLFKKEIKKELETGFSYKAVSETNEVLKKAGYSLQVNPREINLFYAKNDIRERIEKTGINYKVVNTELTFSQEEVTDLLNNEPEVFSPNVITRPLYQQKILPNIAYVGGPGEIAYWLQLKKEFTAAAVNFPVLIPRKFALIVDMPSQAKINKTGLKTEELFDDTEALIKKLINAETEQISLETERKGLINIFSALKQKAEEVDKTLGGNVDGEMQKALKSVEHIEQKIVRSIKLKNEISINQLKGIKLKLFPENTIQERHENFIQHWLKNENFIDELKTMFEVQPDVPETYLILLENN